MGATGSGVFTCAEAVEQPVPRLTGDAAVRALTVDALLTRTLEEVHTLIHIWRGGGESGGEESGGGERRFVLLCRESENLMGHLNRTLHQGVNAGVLWLPWLHTAPYWPSQTRSRCVFLLHVSPVHLCPLSL